jgi:hypothetical protein
LKPELPSQYDWHVQPDCQRPIRLPPERRVSVEFVLPSPSDFRTVLETLQTYRVHRVTVNLWILWKLLISTSQGALQTTPRKTFCCGAADIPVCGQVRTEGFESFKDLLRGFAAESPPVNPSRSLSRNLRPEPGELEWLFQFLADHHYCAAVTTSDSFNVTDGSCFCQPPITTFSIILIENCAACVPTNGQTP